MIDVHCHILPAVDDGARDLADSVGMAAQAVGDGIEVVCATPHIRPDHSVELGSLPARVAALQRELDKRELGLRIVDGGEVAQRSARELTDAELLGLSLGGGGWILLEPGPGPLDDDLVRLVDELAERGLGTVIAHPERHAGPDFERRLRELTARGALIQWTAEFVARAVPGDLVLAYATNGLVHVLGSDAHSSHAGRPVSLSAGIAKLAEVCSSAQLGWVRYDAPTAILAGARSITPPW